jgi:hypothetical protein
MTREELVPMFNSNMKESPKKMSKLDSNDPSTTDEHQSL